MSLALFTKSYGELREAFVRARFAEGQHFRRPDIEEWLAAQRTAEWPEIDEFGDGPWDCYLSTDSMLSAGQGKEIEMLLTYAVPQATSPELAHGECREWLWFIDRLKPLLNSLDLRQVSVYYGHSHGPIVCCKVTAEQRGSKSATTYVFDEEYDDESGGPFAALRKLHSADVMDAIFATWMRGEGGADAKRARDLLCDLLGKDVAKVRAEAEQDFDTAVAASEDGTKIVCADEVVVVAGGREVRCPPERFYTSKILRSPRMSRRVGVMGADDHCSDVLKDVGENCDQVLLETGTKFVFVTKVDYSPFSIAELIKGEREKTE